MPGPALLFPHFEIFGSERTKYPSVCMHGLLLNEKIGGLRNCLHGKTEKLLMCRLRAKFLSSYSYLTCVSEIAWRTYSLARSVYVY